MNMCECMKVTGKRDLLHSLQKLDVIDLL